MMIFSETRMIESRSPSCSPTDLMMENSRPSVSLFNINSPTFSPQSRTWDYGQVFGPFTSSSSSLSPPSSGFLEEFVPFRPRLGMEEYDRHFFSPVVTEQEKEDGEMFERLHITNIPFHYREVDLMRLFRPFGGVEAVQIIYNEMGSKGYGFVTMQTPEAALSAMNNINNAMVGGRIVSVNRAFPKTKVVKQSEELVASRCVWCGEGVSSLELIRAQTKLAEAQFAVLSIKHQLRLSEKNNDQV